MEDTFSTILLVYGLVFITSKSLGHIIGILFTFNPIIGSMVMMSAISVFGMVVSERDLSIFAKDIISLSPIRPATKHMFLFFYGRGRCSGDQVSSVMFKELFDEDDFDKTTVLLIFNMCFYYILSFLLLKIKVNWSSIRLKFNQMTESFVIRF